MRKIITTILLAGTFGVSGCNSLKSPGSFLSEIDAANAIKEALIIGSNFGTNVQEQKGSFNRDVFIKCSSYAGRAENSANAGQVMACQRAQSFFSNT